MRKEEGFALIFALLVMVAVGVLVTGSIFNSLVTQTIARNDRAAFTSQNLAESGLGRFRTMSYQLHSFYERYISEYELTQAQRDRLAGCGSLLGIGFDLDRERNPNGNFQIDFNSGENHDIRVVLPDGTVGGYRINLSTDGTVLRSTGFIGESFATARARSSMATRFDVIGDSPWDNAITAQTQAIGTGSGVNGNVGVFGSIHLTNRNLTSAQTALQLGPGGAGVYNNHRGDSNDTHIAPHMAQVTGNGIRDLCSRVRVASGNINLQGNAHLGVADATPPLNGIPNQLKAVEMGNGTVPTTRVHAENSPAPYTGGDMPQTTIPANFPGDVSAGVVNVTAASCPDFVQSGTFFLPPRPNTNNVTCPANLTDVTSRIRWDSGSTAVVFERLVGSAWVVSSANGATDPRGPVTVNFQTLNVDIGSSAQGNSGVDVFYRGKGSFRVGENATDTTRSLIVHSSLLPLCGNTNTQNCGTGQNRGFPSRNNLALVTTGDMTLGTTSQVDTALLAYARGKITMQANQTTIVGALVGDRFDLQGNQVRVMYEPDIKSNLLTGIPGADATSRLVITTVDLGVVSGQ